MLRFFKAEIFVSGDCDQEDIIMNIQGNPEKRQA